MRKKSTRRYKRKRQTTRRKLVGGIPIIASIARQVLRSNGTEIPTKYDRLFDNAVSIVFKHKRLMFRLFKAYQKCKFCGNHPDENTKHTCIEDCISEFNESEQAKLIEIIKNFINNNKSDINILLQEHNVNINLDVIDMEELFSPDTIGFMNDMKVEILMGMVSNGANRFS